MLALIPSFLESPVIRELDNPATLIDRADYFRERGRDKDALRDYDAALRLEPACAGGIPWLRRGDVLTRLGRWADAARSYQHATTQPLSGRGARAWRSLASALARLGRLDDAIAVLDEFLAYTDDSQHWAESRVEVERARLLHRANRYEDAASAYLVVADHDPTRAAEAGDYFLFHINDSETAWNLYESHPGAELEGTLLIRRAAAALAGGHETTARRLWAVAVERDPGMAEFARDWAGGDTHVSALIEELDVEQAPESEPPTRRVPPNELPGHPSYAFS
jgi:tetratricopeptide (TPR) repeat protein